MLGSIGTGGELAINSRFGQQAGIGNQQIDGIDTGVEVVLEDVEIAVIGIGDLGRNVALGDAVDVVGGDVQWVDYGVERVVDALDDGLEIALVFVGIGACGKLAVNSRFGQHVGISGHSLNRRLNAFNRFCQSADFIRAINSQFEIKIANSHFVCRIDQDAGRSGNGSD